MRHAAGLAMAAALGACSFSADVGAAEKAMDGFHQRLNAGRFDAIYAGASPQFKAAPAQPQLPALLHAVHTRLGQFRSNKTTGWHVNATTSGTFASLNVTSIYTNGQAREAFMYQIAAGRAALVNYQINSPALILH